MYELNTKTIPTYPNIDRVSFLTSTIELAKEYLIVLTNESYAYSHYCGINKNQDFKLDYTMPYRFRCTAVEYGRIQNKIRDFDQKQKFSILCRLLIWNHYAEEFGLERTVIPVKTNPEPTLDKLASDIQTHLEDAQQHFRKVENQMNTLTKFEKETTVTVTLIHGKPVEDYNESELVELIRKARAAQKDISDLVDTSKRMKDRHEKLTADIAIYTEALDSLA
jgi:hypothetical protein